MDLPEAVAFKRQSGSGLLHVRLTVVEIKLIQDYSLLRSPCMHSSIFILHACMHALPVCSECAPCSALQSQHLQSSYNYEYCTVLPYGY